MLREYFDRWKKERAKRAAKKEWLEEQFQKFRRQTEPLVPSAPKHPDAALFRHMWKRAKVLEMMHQDAGDPKLATTYSGIAELAAERYFKVAPEGPYGKAGLSISAQAAKRLYRKEVQLMSPPKPPPERHLSCVYMGTDKMGLVYIGQTLDAPERRWKEHRIAGSGPFNKAANYVQWKVLHEPVEQDDLDEWESYYIGFYNSYESGHNESRGNSWRAYERGCQERLAGKLTDVGD